MRKILAAYTAVILLTLYAPVVVLGVFSFNSSRQSTKWRGFSTAWYEKLWQNRAIQESLENTLVVAAISTVLAVVLGTMAAFAARRAFRGKRAFQVLVSLPLVVPDIVLGVSFFLLFHSLDGICHRINQRIFTEFHVHLSVWTAALAHATFNLSYVAVVVAARLEGLDPSLELAARDLGAGPFGAFWKVTVPAIRPALLSGGLLAFTLSFDDFVVTYFTTGPGSTTLPVQIYSMLRFGLTPEINALTTVILAATFLLIVLSLRFSRVPLAGGKA